MIQFVTWVMAILFVVCVNAIQDGEWNILCVSIRGPIITCIVYTLYYECLCAIISGLVIDVSVAETISH